MSEFDQLEIGELLSKAVADFKAMSPEDQRLHLEEQRASWVRAEMSRPAAKYKYRNGVKVYDSYADYCNG